MPQLPADTRPVAPPHSIDAERLGAWLAANVAPLDGPLEIAQFKGGQSNPTYLLAAGRQRYVLRRKPPGTLLPSAHADPREHRLPPAPAAPAAPAIASSTPAAIGAMIFILIQNPRGCSGSSPGSQPEAHWCF